MIKTFVDLLIERKKEREKYFRNYKFYCKKIKKEAKKILGKSLKVLVFGSLVKGKWNFQSDIDVLIISDNLPKDFEKRGEIRTKIKSKINPFSPFQLHLVTKEEFEKWYKNFIKKDFLEIK